MHTCSSCVSPAQKRTGFSLRPLRPWREASFLSHAEDAKGAKFSQRVFGSPLFSVEHQAASGPAFAPEGRWNLAGGRGEPTASRRPRSRPPITAAPRQGCRTSAASVVSSTPAGVLRIGPARTGGGGPAALPPAKFPRPSGARPVAGLVKPSPHSTQNSEEPDRRALPPPRARIVPLTGAAQKLSMVWT